MEAKFLKRLGAYVLDLLLLSLTIGLITSFIPRNDNNEVLIAQQEEIMEESLNDDVEFSESIHQYGEVVYQIEYNNLLFTIINFVGIILYFVVYQTYNGGKTIGKKLLKIKVVKKDGKKVNYNDILLRSLLINSVAYGMLSMSLILIIKNYNYFITVTVLSSIQAILVIISMFMIIYKKDKRGLHDVLAKTKVIVDEE